MGCACVCGGELEVCLAAASCTSYVGRVQFNGFAEVLQCLLVAIQLNKDAGRGQQNSKTHTRQQSVAAPFANRRLCCSSTLHGFHLIEWQQSSQCTTAGTRQGFANSWLWRKAAVSVAALSKQQKTQLQWRPTWQSSIAHWLVAFEWPCSSTQSLPPSLPL